MCLLPPALTQAYTLILAPVCASHLTFFYSIFLKCKAAGQGILPHRALGALIQDRTSYEFNVRVSGGGIWAENIYAANGASQKSNWVPFGFD